MNSFICQCYCCLKYKHCIINSRSAIHLHLLFSIRHGELSFFIYIYAGEMQSLKQNFVATLFVNNKLFWIANGNYESSVARARQISKTQPVSRESTWCKCLDDKPTRMAVLLQVCCKLKCVSITWRYFHFGRKVNAFERAKVPFETHHQRQV